MPTPTSAETTSAEELLVRRELIDTVRRMVQTLGFPRSLGEIYGHLYVSSEPQSMEQIREQLGMSLGSVSQGLRQLKALKAVKVVYVPGDRKDYFEAEIELRRFVSGFFREVLLPQVEESRHRLEALRPTLDTVPGESEHYRNRFEKMCQWHRTALRWMGPLTRFVNR